MIATCRQSFLDTTEPQNESTYFHEFQPASAPRHIRQCNITISIYMSLPMVKPYGFHPQDVWALNYAMEGNEVPERCRRRTAFKWYAEWRIFPRVPHDPPDECIGSGRAAPNHLTIPELLHERRYQTVVRYLLHYYLAPTFLSRAHCGGHPPWLLNSV